VRIYVGNLSYGTDDNGLNALFAEHGAVDNASVVSDKYTGRSKGFGFVEMTNDEEGKTAIAAINGSEVDGRTLNVEEARPREPRGGGGGGGGDGPRY